MPDNPSKLQNIQLPAESSDSLAASVVETNGSAGGHIDGGSVPGAAKEGVECRPCDCEYRTIGMGAYPPVYQIFCAELAYYDGSNNLPSENCYCRVTKRNLS